MTAPARALAEPASPRQPQSPPPEAPVGRGQGGHLLTVAIEDYFHVAAFNRVIQQRQWNRFERRVEHGVRNVLDLLDEHRTRATFFVLGWVAEQLPELVREVADRGHEIASKGYFHRPVRWLTPSEFAEDVLRADEAIRRASGRVVHGYRMADGWLGPRDLWVLDRLRDLGYLYDSSMAPGARRVGGEAGRRGPHRHGAQGIWEIPVTAVRPLGWSVPLGGNYLRQLPGWAFRRAIARAAAGSDDPLVLYFHSWELDPSLPRISGAPWYQRVRTYRNLDTMRERVASILAGYRFGSIASYLGTPTSVVDEPSGAPRPSPAAPVAVSSAPGGRQRQDIDRSDVDREAATVVIPCYNEEVVLPFLANTLSGLEATLGERYALRFVFVDDGSRDGTWAGLQRLFGAWPNATLVRHDQNRGLAAGIQTGIEQASTEIVCSIDCDCSYDPTLLAEMIPRLGEGVDLVTASPYHPDGQVRNVPAWRLTISRSASMIYRAVLGLPIRTYTSCFRVYRRSAVLAVTVRRTDFLGIAELVGRVALAGGTIVEHPATLEGRLLGRSKMKVISTAFAHLGLLGRFAAARVAGFALGSRGRR